MAHIHGGGPGGSGAVVADPAFTKAQLHIRCPQGFLEVVHEVAATVGLTASSLGRAAIIQYAVQHPAIEPELVERLRRTSSRTYIPGSRSSNGSEQEG